MTQLPFPDVETLARATDPETSHEAAASLSQVHITRTRRMILEVLGAHPEGLTDEGIAARFTMQWTPSGLRTRRHELVRGGLVVDSGRRARSHSGRAAIVWSLPR